MQRRKANPVGQPPADPKGGKMFLRQLERSGFTGADIAAAVGVTKQAVQYWKKTGVPMRLAHEVATLLECTVADLRPEFGFLFKGRK